MTGETDLKRTAIVNQANNQIEYYSFKLFSKVDIGKFSIINTAKFQKKEQEVTLVNLSTLNVPEWITRNTLCILLIYLIIHYLFKLELHLIILLNIMLIITIH